MKKSMSALAALAALVLVAACGGGGGGESEDDSANRTTPANLTRNEWISIPAGTYTVGDDRFVNFPAKKLVQKEAFEIQKYEVMNHEYKAWLDKLPEAQRAEHMPKEHFTGKGVWKGGWYPKGKENHPVVNVSYYSAKAYAEANGWRLPRRLEWEAAARGAEGNLYPWGNTFDASKCNFDSGETKPVGSFPAGASPFGVMDMAGNVWEWLREPFDSTQRAFLLKGGSYQDNEDTFLLSPNQLSAPRDDTEPTQGFRCVR